MAELIGRRSAGIVAKGRFYRSQIFKLPNNARAVQVAAHCPIVSGSSATLPTSCYGRLQPRFDGGIRHRWRSGLVVKRRKATFDVWPEFG
jgi:hypothetical protein